MVSIFDELSNTSPFLIRIPFLIHTPSLTTIASGVASPKLHGHAITSIVIKVNKAEEKSDPNNKYKIKVITEITNIIGTK